MSHHRIGWLIIAITAVVTLADGIAFSMIQHIPLWHGCYCIWMTAITVGGDIQPVHQGYLCLALAPVPLLAAAFSLFTSALANIHVRRAERHIKSHVELHACTHDQSDVAKQSNPEATSTP